MCFSNPTLFYGLWVTTASLEFAATAHKATRPIILAIDLIIISRRRSKLEIKGQDEKTTAKDLPGEVWELVKDQLLGIEVNRAGQACVNHFRCDLCHVMAWKYAEDAFLDGYGSSQGTEPVVVHPWNRWEMPSCEYGYCCESIIESGILELRTTEQLKDTNALLRSHGLQLPSARLWTKDGEDRYYDFDNLMAISLPLFSADFTTVPGFPTIKAGTDHENPSSNVLNFSTEALTVPADANTRFRRLVSSYRPQAVDRTKGSGLAPNDLRISLEDPSPPTTVNKDEKAVDKNSSKKAEVKKEAPRLFANAEPRWMLWSLCEPCM